MAQTTAKIIEEVRRMLQDTRSSSYRNSDADLIRVLNLAMQDIQRLRPDAYVTADSSLDISVPTFVDADATAATDFPIDDMFALPVIYFIVGNIELADDEFAQDGRAATLLQAYRAMLTGGG
jgi:hypothetical protein